MSEHVHELEHGGPSTADLVYSLAGVELALQRLALELKPATPIGEDLDLVAGNGLARSQWQKAEEWTEAIQVDNPYAVTLEVHASRDGGGQVIMRVPKNSSRVLNVRVRDVSLKAIGGAPAGAIPASLYRFDRSQPVGIYPYAP